MKFLCNNKVYILLFFIVTTLSSTLQSQEKNWSDAKRLDSLISLKEYKEAETLLSENISQLQQNKSYLELTKRIYYLGKITLNVEDKSAAIKKVNDFANSITAATDSLSVSRQKHLVLARFYAFIRDYENAAAQNLLALDVTQKIPDATGDLFGLIHHNLSIDNRRQGNIKQAIWHSKKSLDYYLSYSKSDKSKVLDAYNSLGARMWDVFKIDSALYYFKKGEKIINELEPTAMNRFYHKAKSQSNIGSVYAQLGNILEASAYNEKAINNYNNFINSDADGKDFFKEEARLFLFLTIENYADNFIAQGNYTKARDLNEYVYNQLLEHMPENYSEIGYSVLNLGNIYLRLKDFELADTFFSKGLEIYTQKEQNNKLGLADAYYYKGIINDYYGNVDQAKNYYELSKKLYESIFDGSYDNFYLEAMQTYSKFYSENGYDKNAIEMAQKAYDYVIQNQGETTTVESSQLINLASLYFKSKDYDKALKHINQALVIFDASDSRFNDQFDGFSSSLKKPMALLLKSKIIIEQQGKGNPEILMAQYENLMQAISILERQKTLITEDQNLSIILDDNDDVFEFSKQIAFWLYKSTSKKEYIEAILSLHESKLYNKIRQQLNVKGSFSSNEIPDVILKKETVLLAEINQALDEKNSIDRFIEVNKNWQDFLLTLKRDYPKYYDLKYASITKSFEFNNSIKNGQSVIRYVYIYDELYAILIEKDTVNLFELNTKKLNKTLDNFNNENEIFVQNVNAYYDLYAFLWQPLEQSISNKNIIIVPDGNLFNLSFEVLSTKNINSYEDLHQVSLLSRYCISYNYSLLLINKNKKPKFFEKNFVAFSPEFTDEMKSNYKTVITDSVFLDKSYLTLLPQPFATNLAKEYSKIFDGISFINENASKQIFTSRANEHKIIHIGTHAESNNVSPELSRLIFAKNVNDSIATDDNSLYTFEIYNQNLSSNLAILTACETGKPSYQAGEGMISLAHAFNYAGSESMLTSLWEIDEKSSTEILHFFYDNISKGMTKDLALKHAKLEYIKGAKGRTLHPDYWAGLVLIGDTSPIDLKTSSFNISYWLISIVLLIIIVLFIRRNKK
ncbi:CHAT domain-containing protein [uncultured Psychroserpens sp.]|uniref:CHAT domain-containing protein n=1 Tax=uncultured Psychroserpens sp. TaxID=255436 RepID=UPI00262DC224|nr:CHAT domain-containing protein [uncultured Psychroserpens sp.]